MGAITAGADLNRAPPCQGHPASYGLASTLIIRLGFTESAFGVAESVTRTVNMKVPNPVGVP